MRRMMLAVPVVLALAALPSGADAKTRTCGTVFTPTGSTGTVLATRVSCRTARRVVKTFALHGKVRNWKCTATPYEGGAKFLCTQGSGATQKRVRSAIAD
jgi:hypothetical protein